MNFIYIFLLILLLAFPCYSIEKNIYSCFDHSFIPSTRLKSDAKITNISSEKVIYVKNGAKYKTKVTFSDGFIFTTHKTNREDKFFSYNISVDNELAMEIAQRALNAHAKAYMKQMK